MLQKKRLIRLIAIAAALVVAACFVFRDRVAGWAFDQTGEEDFFAQVRGLAQMALNITHPPLELQPYAAVDYTGLNPYGINTFLNSEVEPEKREKQMQLISEAGFRWIREEFPWEDIEIHGRGDFVDRRNDPEGIDAWAKYDQIVDLAEAYDIEIIARLSNPPAWSRAAGDEIGAFAPPDDFDDFANYAAAVAARYRGRIHYYQVWNEPNIYPEWGEQIVNPEAYTDLLCRTYDALKAVDPEIVVISGALAPTSALDGRDFNDYIFLQRMYDAGAGDCFDILAMQGYGLWSGPTDRRMRPIVVNFGRNQFIRDIMVRNGDAHKPIWISEMNWNVVPEDVADARYGRVTLDQQARYAPIAYRRAQEEWPWVGVINLWYFKRADYEWLDGQRPEAYFQVADPDFNLMPIYYSMKACIGQPPVMYPGNHWADHWAVAYDRGWSPWLHDLDRARAASKRAGPLAFTFSGTSLSIVFGAHETPDYGLVVSVDGGPKRAITGCCEETAWRGKSGLHTAIIEPIGEVVITHFIVRDDPRVTPGALVGGSLLLTGAWYVSRRRYLREGADSESSEPDEETLPR